LAVPLELARAGATQQAAGYGGFAFLYRLPVRPSKLAALRFGAVDDNDVGIRWWAI
jgi:hypothetical protein